MTQHRQPRVGAPDNVLEVRGLSKRFDLPKTHPFARRRGVHAVTDVNFSLRRGEALGLVGESGSGKTTVAHLLVRLTRPSSGQVLFDGEDIADIPRSSERHYRRKIQLVFQDPYASLNPRLTIEDTLVEPILVHRLARSMIEAKRRVGELIDLVGLPRNAAARYPHEFSGGQRQRIGIARALAVEPEVLIADEPVSALDVSVQAQIIELLDDLRRRLLLSILLVSHDLGVVGYMCDRIAVMYLGRIVEIGNTASIFERPGHPYTQALLAAIPSITGSPAPPELLLKGDLPSPIDPPRGCVFSTRCPYVLAACTEGVPKLSQVPGGSDAACVRSDVARS